ncbi:hypothetical protein SAMN03159463_04060 [Mesorhizobium sp. NFR06]|nr:hypothetical protein SAMN03159463_04060 [Mesorhizobium sp. NFR06]
MLANHSAFLRVEDSLLQVVESVDAKIGLSRFANQTVLRKAEEFFVIHYETLIGWLKHASQNHKRALGFMLQKPLLWRYFSCVFRKLKGNVVGVLRILRIRRYNISSRHCGVTSRSRGKYRERKK